MEKLASFLLSSGYTLHGFQQQAGLVKRLWNKVNAQRDIFDAVGELTRHRPKSLVVKSENELLHSFSEFANHGIRKIVVKSAAAVGGAGVFFVDSSQIRVGTSCKEFLHENGQNEPDRSPPFLVEERVDWDASPTVDIEVVQRGRVSLVGVALQRLYDGRYYTGFYSSPHLEGRWWFAKVVALAEIVGLKLADLGYVGPANVDFVVSAVEQRVTLIEVNPRRSALIDGFSLRDVKYGKSAKVSISVVDYVNISGRFTRLVEALSACCATISPPNALLMVADGGFSSEFRWAGIWAAGCNSFDSEDILQDAVLQLQDPERDEIGRAEHNTRAFVRISEVFA